MTRIIAGRAGSLTLEVPDAGTRPTSDRVRESLFGALESADALRGRRGARPLRRLRRARARGGQPGAASADLVEKAPRAASVVAAQREPRRQGHGAGCRDRACTGRPRPRILHVARGPFDLVFLDPPYDVAEDGPDPRARAARAVARAGRDRHRRARVALARAGAAARDSRTSRDKKYGDTTLWWVAVARVTASD